MSAEMIGKTFGSYKLVAQVGRGGMASVYRGYQESIDRSVAVKTLPAELLHDPNFLARFLNEARMLARLTHPSILPLYDFGEANGVPYIVMPLMTGGSLADRLQRGAMSVSEVARFLVPIAQALDFAHDQGVLHRDVKPNNILFDQHGNPYLADFGIAKAMESTSSLTGTGIIGTPDYLSPEQARGEALDHRSDIYSLGVVVYQALTGQTVFKATTPVGVIFKHVSEPPRPPRELRPDLSERLEQAILKALAKSPDDRYQTAAEFARTVAMAVSTAPTARAEAAPTSAHPPPAPELVGTPVGPPAQAAASTGTGPQPPAPAAPPAQRRGGMGGWLVGGGIALFALCGVTVCAALFGRALLSGSGTPTALVAVRTPTDAVSTTAPTETVAARPTVRPTARPTATAELAGVTRTPAVQSSSDQSGFFDSFDTNENNWPTGEDDYGRSVVNTAITDGVYRWDVMARDSVIAWYWPGTDQRTQGDLRLSVDARRVSGPTASDYGLTFREVDEDNFYYFGISDEQQYGFFVIQGGEWTTLIDWTAADVIQVGQANRVTVLGEGAHFRFFINGVQVGEAEDDTLSEPGIVGLAIELYNAGDEATFEFDNFEARALGPAVVFDDFSSNANNWPAEASEDEYSLSSLAVADGVYRVEETAHQGFTHRLSPDVEAVADFVVAVEAHMVSGPDDGAYGIVFREDADDNYYYFTVSNSGDFSLLTRYGGEWITLIDWTDTDVIRPGGVNRLEVRAQGAHIVLLINDHIVAETDDDQLAEGTIALAVELYNEGDEAVFEFDNFELRAP
jgi:serine/threonine-protein kinase